MSAVVAEAHEPRIGALGWLRIVVRTAAMLLLLLACVALYYLFHLFRRHNPWPRVFLSGVAWIAGIDVRVVGEKPAGGAFILANHVSWIDIPALAHACGTAFVGHDGLAETPVIGWLCRISDTVFVARHDRKSVAAQVEQVRIAIRDTGALTIFPEGTTSDGTGLLPFKSSLLSALEPLPEGVSVVPVLLDYGAEAADVAWVGTEHGVDNFKRILARGRPVVVTVRFLAALTGDDVKDRKAMAAAGRAALLGAMPNTLTINGGKRGSW